MAWRVVEHGNNRWNVTMAVERRPNSAQWSLVFSCRCVSADRQSVWATYPLSSSSKSALVAQADKLSDEALTAFLSEHLD
jgi:hypothetical protein